MSWVDRLHGFQMQWSSSPKWYHQRSQGLPFKQGFASLSNWLREGSYSQTLILGYAGIIATLSCAGYSSTLPSLEYKLVGGLWHSGGLPWWLVVVDLQPLLRGVAWVTSIRPSPMA